MHPLLLLVLPFLPLAFSYHDPETVPPPLHIIDEPHWGPIIPWKPLTTSPLAASYKCYGAPPRFVPAVMRVGDISLRELVQGINETRTDCGPLPPPGCHLLAVEQDSGEEGGDGLTRVSFCRTGVSGGSSSEDSEEEGSNSEEESSEEEEEGGARWCHMLSEIIMEFRAPGTCFYRGITGGFVRIEEGEFNGDTIVMWRDLTHRPDLMDPVTSSTAVATPTGGP